MDFLGHVVHDRYAIESLLGEGADATVYRAEDRRLGRRVAVKFLRPELRADPTFVARFEREARSAARLEHPGIVAVYDCGEYAGTYFLVLQYIAGRDLRARLRAAAPLPTEEALRIAAEVAEALGAAHARGVVHRDVKPANILLDERGRTHVTDFGIARLLDVPALTASRALVGTPHYLAPEQATGEAITPATDVYALGVVLFEMLTGRRPFQGDGFVPVVMQHITREPPPVETWNPRVPPAVSAIVARALAKAPPDRFADGNALAAALRAQERALRAGPPASASAADRPGPIGAPDHPAEHPPREVVASPETPGDSDAIASAPPDDAAPLAHTARLDLHSGRDSTPSEGSQASPEPPADAAQTPDAPPAGSGHAPWWATGLPLPARAAERPADVPAAGQRGARGARTARDRTILPLLLAVVAAVAVAVLLSGALVNGRGLLAARGSREPPPALTAIAIPTPEPAESDQAPEGEPAPSATAPATAPPAAPTATAVPPTATALPPTATRASTATPLPSPAPPEPTPPASAALVAASAPRQIVLDDDQFDGGFSAPRNYRGRTARWLYGALSPYGEMTGRFQLPGRPGAATLVLLGLDSENGPPTPIEIRLNDRVIYRGGNPLPKDDWRGPVANWGEARIPVPAGVLRPGENTLTFRNLAPVNNFNAPPYFMLDQAILLLGPGE